MKTSMLRGFRRETVLNTQETKGFHNETLSQTWLGHLEDKGHINGRGGVDILVQEFKSMLARRHDIG